MAEVTVYDAVRMKAIEDASVVNGAINPSTGRLELVRFDESVIDGGPVNVSPRIVTSATRPVAPDIFEGVVIYETDTDRFYVWSGTTWIPRGIGILTCTAATRPTGVPAGFLIWESDTDLFQMWTGGAWRRHPWKTAWGHLAKFSSAANSGNYGVSGNSDMLMSGVPVLNTRDYEIHLNVTILLSAGAPWVLDADVDGTTVGRLGMPYQVSLVGEHISSKILWQPAASGSVTIRIVHTELSGSATLQYTGSATNPRRLWIVDIGPRV